MGVPVLGQILRIVGISLSLKEGLHFKDIAAEFPQGDRFFVDRHHGVPQVVGIDEGNILQAVFAVTGSAQSKQDKENPDKKPEMKCSVAFFHCTVAPSRQG